MGEYHRIGSVSDFSEGLVRTFTVAGMDVAVVSHEGAFYAFSGRCPHANYLLNYTRVRPGDRILCSSHFASFDLKSGKVIEGPTNTDLCVYFVRIDGDGVHISTTA